MPELGAIISVGANTTSLERQIGAIVNKSYSINISSKNNGLGTISRDASDFEKSLKAAEARVLAFGATTGIIELVVQAFKKIVSSAVDVEKALTDINVILNTSTQGLQRFGSELFSIARDTGQSFTQVADTAKEFSRQGLGVEQTLIRTRDALILTRLSGLEVKDSVEAITASLNSFTGAALSSTEVINKLAAVDQAFAVSSADLAESVKRVGSTAEDAGLSLDQLLGIVTAVQQTTSRGGAVIGNALKTIFTRLSDNDSISQLKELGVGIDKTQNGLQKLQAISDAIKLNPEYANEIKKIAGGVFQINVVSAAIKDLGNQYNITTRATQLAANATDEATQRNAKLNVTLSALTNETLQNFTEFSSRLGQDLFGPTFKSLLGSINSFFSSFRSEIKSNGATILDAFGEEVQGSDSGNLASFGAKVGEGFIKGVGDYLSGPGVALIGLAMGKLFYNFAVFAKNSVESLFKVTSAISNLEGITAAVNNVLARQPEILNRVLSGSTSIVQAEREVLTLLSQQASQRERQAAIAAGIAKSVLSGTVPAQASISKQTPSGFRASHGFIPNFVNKQDEIAERVGASVGGYTAKEVKEMSVPALGKIIYNTSEKVVDFGMGQPAIMPPRESKAGREYKVNFEKKHGFDPYLAANGMVPSSNKTYSDGLVPNFVKTLGNGAFGVFKDLEKNVGGFDIGKKVFNTSYLGKTIDSGGKLKKLDTHYSSPNDIAKEFDISKRLSELEGQINPIFNFPKVFGNKERSVQAQRIGKEVIKGKTLSQAGVPPDFFQPISSILENSLSKKDIIAEDLHRGNFIGNDKFLEIFNKIKSRGKVSDVAFQLLRKPKNAERITKAIARQGGKISLIDAGNFAVKGSNVFVSQFEEVDKDISLLDAFLKGKGFSQGLVPNFTKELGKGVYGKFLDLEKNFKGIDIGKKIFFNKTSDSDIAKEFKMAKAVEDIDVHPLFKFPKTIGTLENAVRKRRIGKEVVNGDTIDSIANDTESGSRMLSNITAPFHDLFYEKMRSENIFANDSHDGNFVGNKQALDVFRKIFSRDESVISKFYKRLSNSPELTEQVASSIAAKGGRLYNVDPGLFEKANVRYRSEGLVPNFAIFNLPSISKSKISDRLISAFDKGQDYKDFYKIIGDASGGGEKSTAFGGIASALSPRVPDYIASKASLSVFQEFLKGRGTNVDDYLDLQFQVGDSSRALRSLGFFGPKGARRAGLSKALSGQTLARLPEDKTRQYSEALSGNTEAFPIDTNVLKTVFGKNIQGTLTRDSARKLIDIARSTASKAGIEPRQLQAGIFKGANTRFKDQYTQESIFKLAEQLRQISGGGFADGLIPFNQSIIDSVKRENQAGVPMSQIKVGTHQSLVTPQNPIGAGVYNLRDEPHGLSQGINRVASQGLNPRTYMGGMAKGLIPNFVDIKFEDVVRGEGGKFTKRNDSVEQEIQKEQEVLSALNDFKNSIRGSALNQDTVNKFLSEIGNQYNLTKETIQKLNTSIKASAAYQDRITKKLAESSDLGFRGKVSFDKGTSADNRLQPSSGGTLRSSAEIASAGLKFKEPFSSPYPPPSTPLKSSVEIANEKATRDYLLNKQVEGFNTKAAANAANPSLSFNQQAQQFQGQITSSQRQIGVGVNFTNLQAQQVKQAEEIRKGVERAVFEGNNPSQNFSAPGTNFSAVRTIGEIEQQGAQARSNLFQVAIDRRKAQEAERLNRIADEKTRGPSNAPNYFGPNFDENGNQLGTKQYPAPQQRGQFVTAIPQSDPYAVFQSKKTNLFNVSPDAAAERFKLQDLKDFEIASRSQNSKLTKFGNAVGGIGAAFAAPLIEGAGGAAKELIGSDTLDKRRTGSAIDVVTNTASYALSGGLIGSFAGPAGSAIGAIGGAAIGFTVSMANALKNWNNTLPDLENKLKALDESTTLAADGVNRYITASQKLTDIFNGNASATPAQVKRLQEEQSKSLRDTKLTKEEQSQILNAGSDATKINEILAKSQDKKGAEKSNLEAIISAKQFKESYGAYVSNGLGTYSPYQGVRPETLNPEGQNKFDDIFKSALDAKNDKGQQFKDILNDGVIKRLSSSQSKGTDFFTILGGLARKNGFKDTSSILEELKGVATRDNSVNGSTALPKRAFEAISQIPTDKALQEKINNVTKEEAIKSQKLGDTLGEELSRFEKYISEANIGFAKDTGDKKAGFSIDKAQRQVDSQVLEQTSSDLEKSIRKLSNAFKDIDQESSVAADEIQNNLVKQIGELALNSSENIASRTLRNVYQDKNISTNKKTEITEQISSLTREFRNQLYNVKDSSAVRGIAQENRKRLGIIDDQLSNKDISGELRSSLQAEAEVRRQYVKELEKVAAETDAANQQNKKSAETGKTIASKASDGEKAILDLSKIFNVNGSLANFRPSREAGKDLFDLRNQANVAGKSGDIESQIQALVNIGKTFESRGLNPPTDIINQLKIALTDNISSQVKEGRLTLPDGQTPATAAEAQIKNQFRGNGNQGDIKETSFILINQSKEIESQLQLYGSVKEQQTFINLLKQKEIEYQKQIDSGLKDGLQAQQEYTLEVRKQVAAQSQLAFNQGKITGDQYRQARANARSAEKDLNGGRLSNNGLKDAFFDQFKYNTRDLYDELEQGAAEVGQSLKSGFKDAFKSFADGTKSAEGALADFGIGILKKLGDKAFDIATNSIFNVLGSSVSGAFSGFGKANGGLIKGYSVGGVVTGGSGVKDDVPAKLTDGEYVIKKSAVQRYGIDFLDNINATRALYDGKTTSVKTDGTGSSINAVFANAYTYDNPARPTKGEFLIDKKLSVAALDDQNNPQNKIRQDREEALGQYLRDVKAYEAYKKEQIDAFKTRIRRSNQAALVQAGISAVGLGISAYASAGGFSKTGSAISAVGGATGNTVVSQNYSAGVGYKNPSVTGGSQVLGTADFNQFASNPQSFGYSSSQNFKYSTGFGSSFAGSVNPNLTYSYGIGYKRAGGGEIQRFAKGGMPKLFGGDTSTDRIPALLTDGEYVITKKAVGHYGKEFFDKLNKSQIKKFASGGYVSQNNDNGISSSPYTSNNEQFSMIAGDFAKAIEQMKSSIDTLVNSKNVSSQNSSPSIGEININVTIQKNGSEKTDASVSSKGGSSKGQDDKDQNDNTKGAALAEKLTNLVKQTIINEKRPGGLLYD